MGNFVSNGFFSAVNKSIMPIAMPVANFCGKLVSLLDNTSLIEIAQRIGLLSFALLGLLGGLIATYSAIKYLITGEYKKIQILF